MGMESKLNAGMERGDEKGDGGTKKFSVCAQLSYNCFLQ